MQIEFSNQNIFDLVLLLIGIIGTGLSGYLITNRWQRRGKVLEIKTNLTSTIAQTIMRMIMTTEINNLKVQKKAEIIRNSPENQTVDYRNYVGEFLNQIDEEYKTFRISSGVIKTQIESYFRNTKKRFESLWAHKNEKCDILKMWVNIERQVQDYYAYSRERLLNAKEDYRLGVSLVSESSAATSGKDKILGETGSKTEVILCILDTPIRDF